MMDVLCYVVRMLNWVEMTMHYGWSLPPILYHRWKPQLKMQCMYTCYRVCAFVPRYGGWSLLHPAFIRMWTCIVVRYMVAPARCKLVGCEHKALLGYD
jgi:hypothetical protein